MTSARRLLVRAAAVAVTLVCTAATTAVAASPTATAAAGGRSCPPAAAAVGFSDALDKASVGGVAVGGLSGIAADRRSGGYVAVEDHSGTDPARLFFLRDPLHPTLTGALVLRHPDGTPYDANGFDGEGVAVLPDGQFLVSSETEPSVRVFGRDGRQAGELAVPARFAVAPAGEATANATLEGLSVSPSGRFVYAAMEGTLAGDAPASGVEGRFRRILVYTADRTAPGGFRLVRQLGYEVDPGNRIAEVTAYGDGRLVVLEAAFTAKVGNTVTLYAVTGANQAPDVSGVANLSATPRADIVAKHPVADLVRCPTLGATSKEPQVNPLLDNYEGLAVAAPAGRGPASLTLVSDDNFSAAQTTRLLTLTALLP
ncbi:esterase-like activity of phytase family protein [Frankia sp. AgB32]|uniref:esterase-like activity of phytase family protein n=1 Tax=Frankia sp. AgB32 TaxID=631119 RepID=UPI00200EC99A|nr:esterase-like activity of phytase family protein [Frankia sp. AgB32]MCK9897277.1 esterase-like activity of phytase family protein [Frankia sp. AgB32]